MSHKNHTIQTEKEPLSICDFDPLYISLLGFNSLLDVLPPDSPVQGVLLVLTRSLEASLHDLAFKAGVRSE